MSSIGGISSSTTTQTQSTTQVTATTTSTTSSSTFLLDIGLGSLSADLTGLTKPNSPANSALLVQEILALAEELSAEAKAFAIMNQISGSLSAITGILDSISTLIEDSTTVEGRNKILADLATERKKQQGIVDERAGTLASAKSTVEYYVGADGKSGELARQWNSADASYGYWNGEVSRLNGLLNDKNVSKAEKDDIRNNQLPAAERARDSYLSVRNNVYTSNNSSYVAYLNAKTTVDTLTPIVKAATDKIAEIDGDQQDYTATKYTTTKRDEAQTSYEDNTTYLLNLMTGLSALKGGTELGEDALDDVTQAFLDEFADRMVAIAQKATRLLNVDWSGQNKVIASDTDAEATPPRVTAAVIGLVLAIRDMLEAILAISKLDTHTDPGMDEQASGRYHLAI